MSAASTYPLTLAITGCAGFIGSRTAQLALDAGHTVIGIDNITDELYENAPKNRRIEALLANGSFIFHRLDLAIDDLDGALADVDVVLHFAGMAGLNKSWTDPDTYERNNVRATYRLLDAAGRAGNLYIVHASTSSVYGEYAVGDETMPVNPVSPYGETKLRAESLVAEYGLNGRYCILRYFSVYGPDQRPDMAYSRIILALLNGDTIAITGDGNQSRSNTFIDDAARAALLAATMRPENEIINIAGSESIALHDAVSLLGDITGRTPIIDYVPAALGDQAETHGYTEKARRILGWQPHVDYATGFRMQVKWAEASAQHTVLYTAILGDYEGLNELEIPLNGLRAICFTDNPDLTSETWEIVHIDPAFPQDPSRSQRKIKILGHPLLEPYSRWIYIDNTVTLNSDPIRFARDFLAEHDLAIPTHSYRETITDEFDEVIALNLDTTERFTEQREHYRVSYPNLMRVRPLWNGMIFRRNNSATKVWAQLWWEQVLRYSRRDQLSVHVAIANSNVRVHRIPIDNVASEFHQWPVWNERRVDMRSNPREPMDSPVRQLAIVTERLHVRDEEFAAVITSRSWRITAPLRAVSGWIATHVKKRRKL